MAKKSRHLRKAFVRRLGRLAGWVRHFWGFFPLTLLGVLVAASGWWAQDSYAEEEKDYVIYAGAIMALAWTALNLALVLLGALSLFLRTRSSASRIPDRFDTQIELETGFTFPRLRFWPLVLVDMTWMEPGGVSVRLVPRGLRYVERVTVAERGAYPGAKRLFRVSDVFGLSSIQFFVTEVRRFRVAPQPTAHAHAQTMRLSAGEGFSHPSGEQVGELIEMRRYGAGDSMRHILWKTFARTRRLLVRTPERAILPQPSSAAYLISGPGDEAVASTARYFVEAGILGEDAIFCAEGALAPAQHDDEALDQIIASAAYKDQGGQGLTAFSRQVGLQQLGNCILFAPSSPGAWVGKVAQFARTLPQKGTVILAVDSSLEPRRPSRWARWIWGAPTSSSAARELPELVDELARAGLDVRVVHTPTGHVLAREHLARLRGDDP